MNDLLINHKIVTFHLLPPNIEQLCIIINILSLLHIWILVTLNNKIAIWINTALMENFYEANSCTAIFIFINALENSSKTTHYWNELKEDDYLKKSALLLFFHDCIWVANWMQAPYMALLQSNSLYQWYTLIHYIHYNSYCI